MNTGVLYSILYKKGYVPRRIQNILKIFEEAFNVADNSPIYFVTYVYTSSGYIRYTSDVVPLFLGSIRTGQCIKFMTTSVGFTSVRTIVCNQTKKQLKGDTVRVDIQLKYQLKETPYTDRVILHHPDDTTEELYPNEDGFIQLELEFDKIYTLELTNEAGKTQKFDIVVNR